MNASPGEDRFLFLFVMLPALSASPAGSPVCVLYFSPTPPWAPRRNFLLYFCITNPAPATFLPCTDGVAQSESMTGILAAAGTAPPLHVVKIPSHCFAQTSLE